jgi:hypothetical protein
MFDLFDLISLESILGFDSIHIWNKKIENEKRVYSFRFSFFFKRSLKILSWKCTEMYLNLQNLAENQNGLKVGKCTEMYENGCRC